MERHWIAICLVLVSLSIARGQTAAETLAKARTAWKMGDLKEAKAQADLAVLQAPQDVQPYLFRSGLLDALDRWSDGVADLDHAVKLKPDNAELYLRRGLLHFKAGQIQKSIADFDKQIELDPKAKISHWQRGISYYYAGRFDDGKKQFEGYQDFDSNDVENAIWRYLCMARAVGVPKARADMLKIGDDRRVPMREIYELYSGRLQPPDVLKAADMGPKEQKNRQLFYAHLYLGIYFETEGDRIKALEHLNRASDDNRIGHYMWDVARVHRDLLRKDLEKK